MMDNDRKRPLAIKAVREARHSVTSPPETAAVVIASTGTARGLRSLPVSPRVAQGAFLVRVSVGRHRQGLGLAAAHTRLTALRDDDRSSRRRAERSRWLIRTVALLIVPGVLAYEVSSGTSWLAAVWDGAASRDGFLGALSLGAVGSGWTFVVTRREHGLHEVPPTSAEPHAVRSLLASEQLAMRLAAGVPPGDAWQVVAQTNHFPLGSAIPARTVEDALALVEALRQGSRRRQLVPARRRIAAIVPPVVACLLPAVVIIFVL